MHSLLVLDPKPTQSSSQISSLRSSIMSCKQYFELLEALNMMKLNLDL
jgi:hypothetical protein